MAHIKNVQEALQSKNFQEAIKILDQALEANPKDLQSLILKAQVYLYFGVDLGVKGEKQQSQEKLMQSIEMVDSLISLNPKLVEAQAVKGQAIQRLEDPSRFQEAIDCYQKVIDAGKKMPDIFYNKGMCLKQLKQYEMALESLQQAQDLKPQELNYFRAKATLLELLQRYEEAIDEYKKCLKFHPNDSNIYYEMALDQQKLGQEEEQIESYKTAIQLDSTNNQAKYNYAMLLDKKSQLSEARSLLVDVTKSSNDQSILFNSFLAIGVIMQKEKNFSESIKQLEEAIKIDSSRSEPYNQLGIVYSDQQNYQKSLESLQFAILRDPSNSSSHFLLGNCFKFQGKVKEAISAYDKAIQLRPQYYEAILNKGNILLGQSNFEGAIECYDLSLQINPSDQTIYNNKGNALKFLKKFDQALIQYKKAIEINPHFVLAYSNRAKCYIEMQNQLEGLKDLKYVNELIKNPNNTKDLSDQNLKFIKSTIDQIIKIENQFKEVEEQAKRLSQKKQNEINLKLKELQAEKDKQNKIAIALFSDFKDSQNNQSINHQQNIMDQLKQLMSEIDRAENEQIELQKEVDLQVELQKQDEEKVDQIAEILQVTGTYDQAWIAQKFKEYSEESPPDRHDYAKAFYWTILNLFDSYRLASTGSLVINEQKGDSQTEEVGVSVAKAVLSAGSSLPVFGGIFSAIDGAIGAMYKEQKQARIKAIVNIIQNNQDESSQLKEQQSLMFAKAALKVSDLKVPIFKQKNYLRNKETQEFNKRESGIIKFILQKVKDIKESLKDQKDLYSSLGAEEALADVMILMSYMYKNSQQISQLSKDIPLDEQIVEIIQSQSLFKALSLVDGQIFDEKPKEQLQIKLQDVPSDKGSGCCFIF